MVLNIKRCVRWPSTVIMLIGFSWLLGGCHTALVPLKPAAIGPPWAASRQVSTTRCVRPIPKVGGARMKNDALATASPAADGTWIANLSNSTSQIVDIASYKQIFSQALHLVRRTGYRVSWSSYRLGIIVSRPRIGPEVLQWWRPDVTNGNSLMESTLNTFRRTIRLVIERLGKQRYRISLEVLVERRENPQGMVGAVAFNGISAFGGNILPLMASHAAPGVGGEYWYPAGHDPLLEKKLLKELLRRI
ncbi:MAG: hypothetical protein HKL95_11880 [Phycisphaerae bacterium]|nr:hypothetical protein [Phycisphaerae bacterium]